MKRFFIVFSCLSVFGFCCLLVTSAFAELSLETATQQTYWLLNDRRANNKADATLEGDCSASAFQRDIFLHRQQESDFDPAWVLTKLWIEEAQRIRRDGKSLVLGELNILPVILLYPEGSLHPQAAPFDVIANYLQRVVQRQARPLSQAAQQVFGSSQVKPWPGDLEWPPEFLKKVFPLIDSQLQRPGAERTPGIWENLQNLLGSIGLSPQPTEDSVKVEPKGFWLWILSDRIEKNSLVWGPDGQNLLFLSARCLNRVLQGEWVESEWQRTLNEFVLLEWMQAFFLSAQPARYLQDNGIDAMSLGIVQAFMDRPGLHYQNNPLLSHLAQLNFNQTPEGSFEGPLRYLTAPLWHFFYRREGEAFLQKFVQGSQSSPAFLKAALNQEGLYPILFNWLLGLRGSPARFMEGLKPERQDSDWQPMRDVELTPIEAPRGSIAALTDALPPDGIRLFHAPVRASEHIESLNWNWGPSWPQLQAYLFLARAGANHVPYFIDMTPLKPGVTQRLSLDPKQSLSDVFLFIVNRGTQTVPSGRVQVQVSVTPK